MRPGVARLYCCALFLLLLALLHAGRCSGALIEGFEPQVLIADKGYDSDPLIESDTASGIEAVIPPKKNRMM